MGQPSPGTHLACDGAAGTADIAGRIAGFITANLHHLLVGTAAALLLAAQALLYALAADQNVRVELRGGVRRRSEKDTL